MKKKPCKHTKTRLTNWGVGRPKPTWQMYCDGCNEKQPITAAEKKIAEAAFKIGHGHGYAKCRDEIREAMRLVKAMVMP